MSGYGNSKDHKAYEAAVTVRSKMLYEQIPMAFRLIREIVFTSDINNEKRLKELLAKAKARLQSAMVSSGHSTAYMRAMSYMSPLAWYTDMTSGVGFYEELEALETHFEARKEELFEKLEELLRLVFCKENLLVHYTADEDGFALLEKELKIFTGILERRKEEKEVQLPELRIKNEGFRTASKVQFVASAGNFIEAGFAYTGTLRILKVMLGYDYLWNNIRVKGGAYGCMSGFNRIGDAYFVTYRDPNLGKSKEVFDGTPEYLERFDADEQEMRKYIIGTISDLDAPMNPAAKGRKALSMYRNRITQADMQRERDEILSANVQDIQKLAPLVRAVLEQNLFCVVGSEEKIENEKGLFKEIRNLIQDSCNR